MESLQPQDKRLLLACAAIAALSAWYVRANYTAAFPQASLELKLSRDEITRRARAVLKEQGLDTAGFRNLTLFDPDDEARFYLERELGLAEANRLMAAEAPVWRWRARWFRPPDKDERIVYLSPAGRLIRFEHRILETEHARSIGKDGARALAEAFRKRQSAAPHKMTGEQVEKRPGREDYVFTWEQEDFRAKDARIRRTVTVYGGRIGRYEEFLHVPEQWSRDFARLRASNELYASAAQALYGVLGAAALAVLLVFVRRRQIPWKPLLVLGGAVSVFYVLNEWNQVAFFIDGMPTSSPFYQSLTVGLLQALGAGVGVFVYVTSAAAAGEPLYRQRYPRRLRLGAAFTPAGLRTREFLRATVAGYAFAALHLVFLTAFYLYGAKAGVWSPQDVQYSDLLSTPLPWLYPLAISLLAASAEEFWFRLLAVPLFEKYLRSRVLALVAPALVWGFLHANYPQQPGYIRGVEVGLIGIGAVVLMRRFGIVSTLIWHFTVDALLIGLFLFQAEGWRFRLSGLLTAVFVLLPLALSLIAYRRHRGFLPADALRNEALPVEPPPPAPVPEPPPPPLEPRWPVRWLYLAAALALVGGIAARPVQFGSHLNIRVTREDAERAAADAMRARGLDPAQWRISSSFYPNLRLAEFEYARQQLGACRANETLKDRFPAAVWRVRFFRPLEREEWAAFVDQSGKTYRLDHVLDEKAPGARLSAEDARALAAAWLERERGLPVSRHRLVEAEEQKEERRTDHSFVWEDPEFRLGEARARVSVKVVGDHVSEYRRFLKLPEQWLRDFQKPRPQSLLLPGALGALLVPLLIVFLRRLSHGGHRYHWRLYAFAAATGAAAAALGEWNGWPGLFAGYDTATPVENFFGRQLTSAALSVLFNALEFAFFVFAFDLFLQMAAEGRPARKGSARRAAAVGALVWGCGRILIALELWLPGPRFHLPLWSVPGADAALPGLAVMLGAVETPLIALCGGGALLAGALVYFRPRTLRFAAAAMLVALALSRAATPVQAVVFLGCGAALAGLVLLVVRTAAADVYSFFAGLFWLEAVSLAVPLLEQPSPWLRWNGAAALALALLLGLWLLRLLPFGDAPVGVEDPGHGPRAPEGVLP